MTTDSHLSTIFHRIAFLPENTCAGLFSYSFLHVFNCFIHLNYSGFFNSSIQPFFIVVSSTSLFFTNIISSNPSLKYYSFRPFFLTLLNFCKDILDCFFAFFSFQSICFSLSSTFVSCFDFIERHMM